MNIAAPILTWPLPQTSKVLICGSIPDTFKYRPSGEKPTPHQFCESHSGSGEDEPDYLQQAFLSVSIYFKEVNENDPGPPICSSTMASHNSQSDIEISNEYNVMQPSSIIPEHSLELTKMTLLGNTAVASIIQVINNRQIEAKVPIIHALDMLLNGALAAKFDLETDGTSKLTLYNTEKSLVRSMFILETMVWGPLARFEVRFHDVEPSFLSIAKNTRTRLNDLRNASTTGVSQYYNQLISFSATLDSENPEPFTDYMDPGISMNWSKVTANTDAEGRVLARRLQDIQTDNSSVSSIILRVCFGAGDDQLTSQGLTEADDCLVLKILRHFHGRPLTLISFSTKVTRRPDAVKTLDEKPIHSFANGSLHSLYTCDCDDKLYNEPGFEDRHYLYRRYMRHIPCVKCHIDNFHPFYNPIHFKELIKISSCKFAWNQLLLALERGENTTERDMLRSMTSLIEEQDAISSEDLELIKNGEFVLGNLESREVIIRVAHNGDLSLAYKMLCGSFYEQIQKEGIKDSSMALRYVGPEECQKSDLRWYGIKWHSEMNSSIFFNEDDDESDVDSELQDYGERVVLLRASRTDMTEVLMRKLSGHRKLKRIMKREKVYGYMPSIEDGVITMESQASDNIIPLLNEAALAVNLSGAELQMMFDMVKNKPIKYSGCEALCMLAVGYFGPDGTSWLLNQAALGKLKKPQGQHNAGALLHSKDTMELDLIRGFRGVNMRNSTLVRMNTPKGVRYFYKLITGASMEMEKKSHGTLEVIKLSTDDVLGRRVRFSHDIFAF